MFGTMVGFRVISIHGYQLLNVSTRPFTCIDGSCHISIVRTSLYSRLVNHVQVASRCQHAATVLHVLYVLFAYLPGVVAVASTTATAAAAAAVVTSIRHLLLDHNQRSQNACVRSFTKPTVSRSSHRAR